MNWVIIAAATVTAVLHGVLTARRLREIAERKAQKEPHP